MDNYLKTKTAKNIVRAFEKYIRDNSDFGVIYSNWYVGITKNPHIREAQHRLNGKNTYKFAYMWARSKNIAVAVEQYFHAKGMGDKDHSGGAKYDAWYVYVFKKNPNILDVIFR